MIEKLRYFLEREGFKKLSYSAPGIDIFFIIENHYVNAVLLVNQLQGSSLSFEQYDQIRQKTTWKFYDGGNVDVHMLSVIVTQDPDQARLMAQKEAFVWYVDAEQKSLIVDPDKAEDFYGLRAKLSNWIVADYDPKSRSALYDELYDTKGRRYYQSVLDRPVINHGFFVVNVLVFTLCLLTGELLIGKGDLDFFKIFSDRQWYRVLTSMFLHGDMQHITGNMLILYYMGDLVERAFGHIKYAVLYLFSGLVAAAVSLWFSYFTQDFTPSIGASGAIFGVIGALLWIAIRNHGQYAIFNVRKILFLIGYSLYSGLIATNVDNAAHIGGLIGGFLFAVLFYRKNSRKKMQERME